MTAYRLIPPAGSKWPPACVSSLTYVELAMEQRLTNGQQEIRAARRLLRDGAPDVMIGGWKVIGLPP